MRKLLVRSDPGWLERAIADSEAILLDHAHCEKKAASTAVKLLFTYPHHAFLQRPLSELAREELVHFERVLDVLERRGIRFQSQSSSPYMSVLLESARKQEPGRLVDRLLCSALIEGRSCERFQLLAEAHPDPELRALYRDLLIAEARHQRLYVELAEALEPAEAVQRRLAELAAREAAVLAAAPPWPRLHCA